MDVVFWILLAFTSCFACENSDLFINELNTKQSFWTAGRNFHDSTDLSTLRILLGAKSLPREHFEKIPILHHQLTDELPETFDARSHWPHCKTISLVTDQASCGSCWAVSVASSISDRICIHSEGKRQPEISARNLLACSLESHGCLGGYPYLAWEYWQQNGLVTGGSYDSKIGCQPYSFAPCEHDVNGTRPQCIVGIIPTPKCLHECDNSSITYSTDLRYGASAYRISSDEEQIQQEILKNGPVVAIFRIYTDFFVYKSGVYVKTQGLFQGKHAVKVIGWGVENQTKYWLVMNSWNEDWGDQGLFKIRRGTNEVEFESEITAGLPK